MFWGFGGGVVAERKSNAVRKTEKNQKWFKKKMFFCLRLDKKVYFTPLPASETMSHLQVMGTGKTNYIIFVYM